MRTNTATTGAPMMDDVNAWSYAKKQQGIAVDDGVALCERCGLKVRWINNYRRGDATIGVVDHSYTVTTGSRAT